MYLYLGADKIVKKSDIIGIFDLDGKTTSLETKKFLMKAQKCNLVESAGYDLPKSFIVVKSGKQEKIIFSHIAVASLVKRMELPF